VSGDSTVTVATAAGDRTFNASTFNNDGDGCLYVKGDRGIVATFAPGGWTGVWHSSSAAKARR